MTLTLLYASFLRLGIFEGGERELIDRLGQGRTAEANRVQRIAFTGDLLWSLLPAAGLLAMSAAFDDPIRRIGFVLAPLMFIGTTLYRRLMQLYLARQRFDVVAPVNAIRALGQPLLMIGLLFVIGPLSLLVAPLLIEWLLVGVYLRWAPRLDLRRSLRPGRAVAPDQGWSAAGPDGPGLLDLQGGGGYECGDLPAGARPGPV